MTERSRSPIRSVIGHCPVGSAFLSSDPERAPQSQPPHARVGKLRDDLQLGGIPDLLPVRHRALLSTASPDALGDAAGEQLPLLHGVHPRLYPDPGSDDPRRLRRRNPDRAGLGAGPALPSGRQHYLERGLPLLLQILQLLQQEPRIPGAAARLAVPDPRPPDHPADRAVVSHVPGDELYDRGLPGPPSGRAPPGDLCSLRDVLPAARRRADRAAPEPAAPVPRVPRFRSSRGSPRA